MQHCLMDELNTGPHPRTPSSGVITQKTFTPEKKAVLQFYMLFEGSVEESMKSLKRSVCSAPRRLLDVAV